MNFKIRVWDDEKKKMIYVKENTSIRLFEDGSGRIVFHAGESAGGDQVLLNLYPDTPKMVSIGFKDKNGKEIYEGDIVVSFKKPYEDNPSTNVVELKKGCWTIVCKGKSDIPLFNYSEPHIEIIGNIYQNPELIKT